MTEWSCEEIDVFLQSKMNGCIYLYTPLCGTCQVASKMLEVTSQIVAPVQMGKLDLNYAPSLAQRWSIESVPCLLIFKEGELLEKIYAFHSVPNLVDKIRSIL